MRTHRTGVLSGSKIKKPPQLKAALKKLQAAGKRVVFTNGCFDLLHLGHASYLEKAKQQGDILVVGLNSDGSVRKIKGRGRPILPERDRAGVIAALESVDYVVIFKEATPLELIKLLKPDVLIKGADWKNKYIVGSDIVAAYGGKVATINYLRGRSTSNIIKRVGKSYSK